MLDQVSAAVGANNLKRAADIADAALSAGNRHPAFFNARALLAQSQGNQQAALDEFEKALVLTPQDPLVLKAIGLCLVRLNRPQEGISRFDTALRFEPNDAQTYYFKGWALAADGDQNGAKRAYERAIALQPIYPEALAALATIAARSGDRGVARQLANRALYSFDGATRQTPIPGNVDPTHRFVRADYYRGMLPEPKNDREAIASILAIARNVSVPFGAPNNLPDSLYSTEYRSAIDITNRRYYFELTTTPSVIWADLTKFDLSEGSPVLVLDPNDISLSGDVTKNFKPANVHF